jgi:large subunit ribosomal protein L3
MANEQIGLLGRKLGMTQIFDEAGVVSAVTILEVQANTVVQVKTTATKDGYAALQLGYGSRKESRVTKAALGPTNKVGARPFRLIREIRVSDAAAATYTAGQQIAVSSVFAVKQKVDVVGNSKGRGFAGVFKRWNFSGFKRSHGVHEYYRHGGSIGTRLTPGMTFKGVKMPGRMGGKQKTIQNLVIVRIDEERNLVFVRGGVPGPDGSYIVIRAAVKGKTPRRRK